MSGNSDPNKKSDPYGTVKVDPDPGFTLMFDGLEAIETLGHPFQLNLDVSATKSQSDLVHILGASVTVSFTGPDKSKRYYNGILTRILYAGLSGGAARYHLELRPWIWLLSRKQDCKIYQKTKAFDIITQVFRDAGFSDFADKRQASAGDQMLDFCVQYRETSLDFVTRMMERFGIYYYFTFEDGKHTLNLADDPNCHKPLDKAIPYQRDMTEIRNVADHIWAYSSDMRLQTGMVTNRDYNFTTPSADLTAKSNKVGPHSHGSQEVYDYPGVYDTAADGRKLTDIRIQEFAGRRQVFSGSTNARKLVCGAKFELKEAVDKAMNGKYVVIGATSHFGMGESKSGSQGELTDSYHCDFQAIPDTTPFRLERVTPLPMIRGPQTAKVVGKPGDEITTDEYGRIKVKFYWDRVNPEDDTASCWIRVSQAWAGKGWGAMVIPRIGQEVIVEFLEGNPDRPIVTGCVYNATQTVPYPLPANATRSTMKSNSSKGGGGFNELRFEDKKGEEEVFFQAQYDYNKKVLHDETVEITNDTTTTVKDGNRKLTVSSGNNTTEVKGNDKLTVSSGNHSIDVSAGKSDVTAAQAITLTVGGNSIKIDTSQIKLTVGGSTITLSAAGVETKGPTIKVAADATSELTAGATMKVDGGGMLTVTGGLVKIN